MTQMTTDFLERIMSHGVGGLVVDSLAIVVVRAPRFRNSVTLAIEVKGPGGTLLAEIGQATLCEGESFNILDIGNAFQVSLS